MKGFICHKGSIQENPGPTHSEELLHCRVALNNELRCTACSQELHKSNWAGHSMWQGSTECKRARAAVVVASSHDLTMSMRLLLHAGMLACLPAATRGRRAGATASLGAPSVGHHSPPPCVPAQPPISPMPCHKTPRPLTCAVGEGRRHLYGEGVARTHNHGRVHAIIEEAAGRATG